MSWQDVLKHITINSNKEHDLGFFLGTGNETVVLLDEILIPYLQCYEIKNFGAIVSVASKKGVTIYLVEPSKQLNYRMMKLSMIGDTIYQVAQKFTSTTTKTFLSHLPFTLVNKLIIYFKNNYLKIKEFSIFQAPRNNTALASNTFFSVSTRQRKKRQDLGTCTNENFSDCSLKAIKTKLLEILNCTPPWLRKGQDFKDSSICYKPVEIADEEAYKRTVQYLEKLVFEIKFQSDVRIENEDCIQSCTQLIFDIKNIATENADYASNWININFAQKVKLNRPVSCKKSGKRFKSY